MKRDPLPQPMTLDGNQLAVRNVARIRSLLGVLNESELRNLVSILFAAALSEVPAPRFPIYEGRAPSLPDDPSLPALNFPLAGGVLKQWSPSLQKWV